MYARRNRQLAFPAEKVLRGRLQAVQGTAAPVVLLALDDPSAVVALQLPTRSVAGPIHVCASVDVCSVAAIGARRGSGLTLHTVAVGVWVICPARRPCARGGGCYGLDCPRCSH